METYPLLFSPLRINRLELSNRIVMPAMHLNYTPEGKVTDQLVAFYRQRAQGGAGLIIVGGCTINQMAGGPIFISLREDDDIEGLRRLTQAVREQGAAIGAQLYMAGAYAHSILIGQQAMSASVHTSGYTREEAREMSLEEIAQVQDDWASAARRAQQAGFDMVEILGSAGYLICQFLSPKINKRQDEYGGSLQNRMRFGLETVAKVRAAVGPDFCLGIRIAGSDFVPGSHGNAEAAQFAAACARAGVDMINVTGGWHETRVPQITNELPAGGFAYLARGIKREVNLPVAVSNRINRPDLAEAILARGDGDLVCLGRPLLADPRFPVKARQGQAHLIRCCIACNQGCFDRIPLLQPAGCLVNPRAGQEHLPEAPPAEQPRRVLVVGGGAAGCQAALSAARRGHRVILLEASERLGGQVAWYPQPTGRPAFACLTAYYEAALVQANVDVRLNTRVETDLIQALEPQAVILATGAVQAKPPIPGVESDHVVGAWEVLKGQVLPRGRVVVIGGGAVGLETALYLARQGALTPEQVYFLTLFQAEPPQELSRLVAQGSYQVSVVEMLPKVGQDIGRSTRWIVLSLLKRFGVKLVTKAQVKAIEPGQVLLSREDGPEETLRADTVVLATGVKPVNGLAEQVQALGLEVRVVGDAAGGASLLEAVAQGYRAGCEV